MQHTIENDLKEKKDPAESNLQMLKNTNMAGGWAAFRFNQPGSLNHFTDRGI